MSSYGWSVEFWEIHNRIAWRSLYRFGYQSCWLQFLVFLGKPWENLFISLCWNPLSLMVVGNGINRITPHKGQSKTAPAERQSGQNIPNFFPYCTGGSWIPIPPHFQHAECLRRALQQGLGWKMSCLGTGQNEEGTSKSHPWTRKRWDFHPWESFMFRQVKEPCKFPWVPEEFLFAGGDELAATRRAKGAVTPNSVHGSLGVWFHSCSCLQLDLGFFHTAPLWESFVISWLSNSVRFWK